MYLPSRMYAKNVYHCPLVWFKGHLRLLCPQISPSLACYGAPNDVTISSYFLWVWNVFQSLNILSDLSHLARDELRATWEEGGCLEVTGGRGQLWFPCVFMARDKANRQAEGYWHGLCKAGENPAFGSGPKSLQDTAFHPFLVPWFPEAATPATGVLDTMVC